MAIDAARVAQLDRDIEREAVLNRDATDMIERLEWERAQLLKAGEGHDDRTRDAAAAADEAAAALRAIEARLAELTDEAARLAAVGSWLADHCGSGAVMACSALKRSYRDILRRDNVLFVHLAGSPAAIADRIAHRHNHFMPSSLLESQLATLEPLGPDENGMVVDITGSPAEEAADVLQRLGIERG